MDRRTRSAGRRRERNQGSPRFADGGFRNTVDAHPSPKKGTRMRVAREFLFGDQVRRPPRPLPAIDPRPAWTRPVDSGLRTTWLGHSTVLIEIDGARVLTDPVWSERISPFGFAAPRRFQPVPIDITAVPALDAIVISHDHFDHLDRDTIVALAPRSTPFVVPLGVGMYLEAWGIEPARIIELDWWEAATIGGVRITATPAQHFSKRVGRRNQTLWSSFVIESHRHRVFFSGDTALTPEFADVADQLGPFDLVMLEVGGFDPAWDHVHLGPRNALEALRLLGGGTLMPIHWGTFNLALHAWDFPAETLIAETPPDVELVMPQLGAAFEPAHRVVEWHSRRAWWRPEVDSRREVAVSPLRDPAVGELGTR